MAETPGHHHQEEGKKFIPQGMTADTKHAAQGIQGHLELLAQQAEQQREAGLADVREKISTVHAVVGGEKAGLQSGDMNDEEKDRSTTVKKSEKQTPTVDKGELADFLFGKGIATSEEAQRIAEGDGDVLTSIAVGRSKELKDAIREMDPRSIKDLFGVFGVTTVDMRRQASDQVRIAHPQRRDSTRAQETVTRHDMRFAETLGDNDYVFSSTVMEGLEQNTTGLKGALEAAQQEAVTQQRDIVTPVIDENNLVRRADPPDIIAPQLGPTEPQWHEGATPEGSQGRESGAFGSETSQAGSTEVRAADTTGETKAGLGRGVSEGDASSVEDTQSTSEGGPVDTKAQKVQSLLRALGNKELRPIEAHRAVAQLAESGLTPDELVKALGPKAVTALETYIKLTDTMHGNVAGQSMKATYRDRMEALRASKLAEAAEAMGLSPSQTYMVYGSFKDGIRAAGDFLREEKSKEVERSSKELPVADQQELSTGVSDDQLVRRAEQPDTTASQLGPTEPQWHEGATPEGSQGRESGASGSETSQVGSTEVRAADTTGETKAGLGRGAFDKGVGRVVDEAGRADEPTSSADRGIEGVRDAQRKLIETVGKLKEAGGVRASVAEDLEGMQVGKDGFEGVVVRPPQPLKDGSVPGARIEFNGESNTWRIVIDPKFVLAADDTTLGLALADELTHAKDMLEKIQKEGKVVPLTDAEGVTSEENAHRRQLEVYREARRSGGTRVPQFEELLATETQIDLQKAVGSVSEARAEELKKEALEKHLRDMGYKRSSVGEQSGAIEAPVTAAPGSWLEDIGQRVIADEGPQLDIPQEHVEPSRPSSVEEAEIYRHELLQAAQEAVARDNAREAGQRIAEWADIHINEPCGTTVEEKQHMLEAHRQALREALQEPGILENMSTAQREHVERLLSSDYVPEVLSGRSEHDGKIIQSQESRSDSPSGSGDSGIAESATPRPLTASERKVLEAYRERGSDRLGAGELTMTQTKFREIRERAEAAEKAIKEAAEAEKAKGSESSGDTVEKDGKTASSGGEASTTPSQPFDMFAGPPPEGYESLETTSVSVDTVNDVPPFLDTDRTTGVRMESNDHGTQTVTIGNESGSLVGEIRVGADGVKEGFIGNVMIDENARGSGRGKDLQREFIATAQEQGVERLTGTIVHPNALGGREKLGEGATSYYRRNEDGTRTQISYDDAVDILTNGRRSEYEALRAQGRQAEADELLAPPDERPGVIAETDLTKISHYERQYPDKATGETLEEVKQGKEQESEKTKKITESSGEEPSELDKKLAELKEILDRSSVDGETAVDLKRYQGLVDSDLADLLRTLGKDDIADQLEKDPSSREAAEREAQRGVRESVQEKMDQIFSGIEADSAKDAIQQLDRDKLADLLAAAGKGELAEQLRNGEIDEEKAREEAEKLFNQSGGGGGGGGGSQEQQKKEPQDQKTTAKESTKTSEVSDFDTLLNDLLGQDIGGTTMTESAGGSTSQATSSDERGQSASYEFKQMDTSQFPPKPLPGQVVNEQMRHLQEEYVRYQHETGKKNASWEDFLRDSAGARGALERILENSGRGDEGRGRRSSQAKENLQKILNGEKLQIGGRELGIEDVLRDALGNIGELRSIDRTTVINDLLDAMGMKDLLNKLRGRGFDDLSEEDQKAIKEAIGKQLGKSKGRRDFEKVVNKTKEVASGVGMEVLGGIATVAGAVDAVVTPIAGAVGGAIGGIVEAGQRRGAEASAHREWLNQGEAGFGGSTDIWAGMSRDREELGDWAGRDLSSASERELSDLRLHRRASRGDQDAIDMLDQQRKDNEAAENAAKRAAREAKRAAKDAQQARERAERDAAREREQRRKQEERERKAAEEQERWDAEEARRQQQQEERATEEQERWDADEARRQQRREERATEEQERWDAEEARRRRADGDDDNETSDERSERTEDTPDTGDRSRRDNRAERDTGEREQSQGRKRRRQENVGDERTQDDIDREQYEHDEGVRDRERSERAERAERERADRDRRERERADREERARRERESDNGYDAADDSGGGYVSEEALGWQYRGSAGKQTQRLEYPGSSSGRPTERLDRSDVDSSAGSPTQRLDRSETGGAGRETMRLDRTPTPGEVEAAWEYANGLDKNTTSAQERADATSRASIMQQALDAANGT